MCENLALLISAFVVVVMKIAKDLHAKFPLYGIKSLQYQKYIPSSLVKMDRVVLSPHPTAVQACTETV